MPQTVDNPAWPDDDLDCQALAWVDAFRDHGHAVSFDEVRTHVANGNDQIVPIFLPGRLMDTIGGDLQAYRDRLLMLRYFPDAPAGAVPCLHA